jgi:hypothetical protein
MKPYLMKFLKKITNGIILIVIGLMHTQFALSAEGFGKQFREFSQSNFFYLFRDLEKLRVESGRELFESFAAFWFFYFGILIIPLGLLVHSIEKRYKILPHSFTISYLVVVLIGCYMVPESGMTYFMLPQAIYMLASNYIKARKEFKLQER